VAEAVLAAVRTGPSKTEIREYPMPDVPADAALMKMEVAGICGTDVKLYAHPPNDKPTIMGHENIGVIAKAGREFTARKGFREGDLVFVEHYVSCGKCEWCHQGQYRHCENTNWRTNPDAIRYGYTSDEKPPHLWGGFAQYVYLPWNAVVHHVPEGVTAELAGLVTPMANGVEGSLMDGGVGYDCTAGAGTIPILLGIEALKRKAGIIVAQGELREFPNFPLEKFTVKFITMKSARGHSYKACELALEQIASKRFPLELITTHKFGLKYVDLAIRSVGNESVPDVIHASLTPWE